MRRLYFLLHSANVSMKTSSTLSCHMYILSVKPNSRSYLFELHHDVFRKLHILEHPLQFAGERRSTFCGNITKATSRCVFRVQILFLSFISHRVRLCVSRSDGLNLPCFSFDNIDFSASTEALFPTSNLLAKSFL